MPKIKSKKNKDVILVVVESPAKAQTINKYLGTKYKVASSMGHLIDLPKSRLGVNVENNFTPEYITVRGKGKVLSELKKYASNSLSVLLASDNDREGEAIAFLIKEELLKKFPELIIKRIVFNEITKPAILEAVNHPRNIETDMINAQRTRRVLDRLVGYNISPILWEKVKRGLSAGRVQSVALRIICEREAEIEKFVRDEYWTLEAVFLKEKKEFTAELFKIGEKKPDLKDKKEVDDLMNRLDRKNFIIDSIQNSTKSIKPQPPFITSKFQQAAANRFGFTSRKSMQVAQQLYEGINIGKERVGLITYMRTDSTRIASQALDEVRDYINQKYPAELPETARVYSKSSGAQDAHEAIRPTSVLRAPAEIKEYLSSDQFKIYSIIWERFVSSQMSNAEYLVQTINIKNDDVIFRITKSDLTKPGFIACLDKLKTSKEKTTKLPKLKENDKVDLKEYIPLQHFTQPPPRYTDASIVKILEENGIGRPSTYAPIISTLQSRFYVTRKARQLVPTVLGRLVNSIIVEEFSNIVNVDFTAKMEEDLDQIAQGNLDGVKLLNDFYTPFIVRVKDVTENLADHKKMFDEPTDEICDKCGRPMLKKLGRYGFFIACSGFPECRNSKPIPLGDCPKDGCDGKIVTKRKKTKGREFYGCTKYPDCDFVTWDKPTEFKCPKCNKFLVEKTDKVHGTYKLCIDKDCGYKQIEIYSNN